MKQTAAIAFVLPTKNEQNSIGSVISDLVRLAETNRWHASVIITDDSNDSTAMIAQSLGATVVNGGGVGLGHAMVMGLREAMRIHNHLHKLDWVISLDSDGQVDCNEILQFLSTAEREQADLVLSSRFSAGTTIDYRYPRLNWCGNRILVATLRLATGLPITDSHGGIRIMRPALVQKLSLIGRHTYVQEFIIQAHRNGSKIIELSSRWKKRESGQSRVLQSILRYVARTLPALLYYLRLHIVFLTLATLTAFRIAWLALHGESVSTSLAVAEFLLMLLAVYIRLQPRYSLYVVPTDV